MDGKKSDGTPTPGFADIVWTAEDVQTLRPDLTEEQATEFLERNERHLRDRMIEYGWEVMEILIGMDDEIPAKPVEEK